MKDAKLLLVDTDDYSASVLLDELRSQGFERVARVSQALAIPASVALERPDLVLFNHHYDRPGDLLGCCTAKSTRPDTVVVALAAAGPAARSVREWAATNGCVDAVLQKPLAEGELLARARDLVAAARSRRQLQERNDRLASLLPQGAVDAAGSPWMAGQEELFEAAVVFTDVRRSSDVITCMPPRDFFRLLNRSLSAQASLVRRYQGQVVKYTGDGLMAVFRGMGRTHLALRCGVELAAAGKGGELPYGVGAAEGLVLAGLVGSDGADSQQQYDVIGATVHLAARLCGLAGPGELLTTQAAHSAARLQAARTRTIPAVEVRGFREPIDCVALASLPVAATSQATG